MFIYFSYQLSLAVLNSAEFAWAVWGSLERLKAISSWGGGCSLCFRSHFPRQLPWWKVSLRVVIPLKSNSLTLGLDLFKRIWEKHIRVRFIQELWTAQTATAPCWNVMFPFHSWPLECDLWPRARTTRTRFRRRVHPQGGRLGPAIRLHEPRMLHAALSKENHGRTLGFSTGQDGDSGNHPEIESKVQSKPPPSFL